MVAFLALYSTVTWSLIKYSTREKYRYWAMGWVIYTIGAFLIVLFPMDGLSLLDAFSISGMFVGATLIQDGSRERKLTRKRIIIYLAGIVMFSSLLAVGLLFNWDFYLVFTPLGLHIAYVCLLSAKTVSKIKEPVGTTKLWLIGGLTVWGVSWMLFPLVAILPEFYPSIIFIQSVGVLMSGASMLTLFMRTVTRDLERQYMNTQIMSSLVQHDIRNYIQAARLALDLTENPSIVNDHWIRVALTSLDGARDFVDEMREIAATLTRFKPKQEPTNLFTLIDSVKQRVISEYSIESDQLKVEISKDSVILACRLSRELLWNIFDNSFKHGSDVLLVNEINRGNPHVTLEISDRGGGLSDNIKMFLNNQDSVSEQTAPGLGLGIILIQSLSQMCGARIHTEDVTEESKVIGTKYILTFRKANDVT